MYNYLAYAVGTCATTIHTLYTGVRNAFSVKTHILFEGISTPYDKVLVNTGAPSSAMPLWWYNKDETAFIEWSPLNDRDVKKGVSLPILSMTIVDEGRAIHDLTDFLETVRVFHTNGVFPSIAHILGAWSLSSGIVLNTKREYFASIITSDADTLALPVDTHEYYTAVQASTATPEID
jgi:hypothetical protein